MTLIYDLILKDGEVLDPTQNLRGKRDVAFKDGKVARVSGNIPSEQGDQVIDVTGKLVVPGLIDIHGHFAYKLSIFGADPDRTNLTVGVTTAVDAGSTGWMNFPAFRSYVIEKVDTRLLAFLHLSSIGTMPTSILIPDLEDFRFAKADEAIECIERNRDLLLGVKVRLSPNGTTMKNAVPAMEMARQIADRTKTRIMVHVMESPIPLSQVFEYLEPGDIVTHIFHSDTHSILDERHNIRPEVWAAYERGIVFDTGCCMRHFSIPVCQLAIKEGLLPHTLSTDRVGDSKYVLKNYNMLEIMSLFLAMGMSEEQVVKSVTTCAASAINRGDLGTLRIGTVGDAAVLELEKGHFTYEDMLGNEITSGIRFTHALTIREGIHWRPQ